MCINIFIQLCTQVGFGYPKPKSKPDQNSMQFQIPGPILTWTQLHPTQISLLFGLGHTGLGLDRPMLHRLAWPKFDLSFPSRRIFWASQHGAGPIRQQIECVYDHMEPMLLGK